MAPVTSTGDITTVLNEYVGTIVARSIVNGAANACGIDPGSISPSEIPCYLRALDNGVQAFVMEPTRQRECSARLRALLESSGFAASHAPGLMTCQVIDINQEIDIVTARNHTRSMCERLGFGASEQIKIATVVSELARNIVLYVGRGRIELEAVNVPRRGVEIRAIDQGGGIQDIDQVLSGKYRSKTGMGVGLLGTKRLMDEFAIDTNPLSGTKLVVRKYL